MGKDWKPEETTSGGDADRLVAQTMAGFDPGVDWSNPAELQALVEALLLAAPGPVTVAEVAAAAECEVEPVEDAIAALDRLPNRGWVIQRHGRTVQLATDPRFADHVRRLLGFEREARLSAAALETLAIVAYQEPVTRAVIESVRGVDSSAVLATLLNRGLIEAGQRLDLPGQPFEYRTTPVFLQHFGIRSLDDLPELSGADGASLSVKLREAVEEAARPGPELELVGATIEAASAGGELANA
jgi:segregation and condensation protein B